jgi:hypothetical protein
MKVSLKGLRRLLKGIRVSGAGVRDTSKWQFTVINSTAPEI